MKKTLTTLVGLGLIVAASPAAGAPTVAVTDPNGSFSGSYVKSQDDPSTTENEYQEGYQQGYVGVYTNTSGVGGNGVVVCDGSGKASPDIKMVWLGTSGPASGTFKGSTLTAGGFGRMDRTPSDQTTGHSPCPDENPDGANE